MEVPISWDALRKQARKLESQLDEQMSSYRKLVSAKVDDADNNDLESGIDRLLKQLQQVDSQMQAWVSSGGSEIVSHTLTRHQEILQDLTQCRSFISSTLASEPRENMLHSLRILERVIKQEYIWKKVVFLKSRLFLKSMHPSAEVQDRWTLISQAQTILGGLSLQRTMFGGLNSKLTNVSSRLPTVNNILSAIKRRKSMDTIILSLVASVCTFLILIYWLTK